MKVKNNFFRWIKIKFNSLLKKWKSWRAYLIIINSIVSNDVNSREFFQNVHCSKGSQVVDEDVWYPEVVQEVQIYWGVGRVFNRIVRHEPWFIPDNREIHCQGNTELLIVYLLFRRRKKWIMNLQFHFFGQFKFY